MLIKTLRLTPSSLKLKDIDLEKNIRKRVFNVDYIEINHINDQYQLNTEIGKIELEEQDEILIENFLLTVSYKYKQMPIAEHPWQDKEEFTKSDELFMKLDLSDKSLEKHPLAFLFNKTKTEKE